MSRYNVRGVPRGADGTAKAETVTEHHSVLREVYPSAEHLRAEPKFTLRPKESFEQAGFMPGHPSPVIPIREEQEISYDDTPPEEDDLETGSRNLMIALLVLVVVVMLSVTGYYVTPYKNGVPVRMTLEDMASAKYIKDAQETIVAIDKAHTAILSSVNLYNQRLQNAGQTLQVAREQQAALDKLVMELERTDPPPNFAAFHGALTSVAKIRIEANRHLISHFTDPTRDHLTDLADRLTDFEDAFTECQVIFARLQKLT